MIQIFSNKKSFQDLKKVTNRKRYKSLSATLYLSSNSNLYTTHTHLSHRIKENKSQKENNEYFIRAIVNVCSGYLLFITKFTISMNYKSNECVCVFVKRKLVVNWINLWLGLEWEGRRATLTREGETELNWPPLSLWCAQSIRFCLFSFAFFHLILFFL